MDRILLEGRLQYELPNFGLITEKVKENELSVYLLGGVGWGGGVEIRLSSEGSALEGFDEITDTTFSLGFLVLGRLLIGIMYKKDL